MVRFLSMFLVGWLLAEVMRGSMNHITPVVIPVLLICIAFTLANKRYLLMSIGASLIASAFFTSPQLAIGVIFLVVGCPTQRALDGAGGCLECGKKVGDRHLESCSHAKPPRQ